MTLRFHLTAYFVVVVGLVKHFDHLSGEDKAFCIMSQENERAAILLADYIWHRDTREKMDVICDY